MDCHESLMQRRRKKKANASNRRAPPPGARIDKSLPSLPPSMQEAQAMEDDIPNEAHTEPVRDPSHSRLDEAGDGQRSEGSPPHQEPVTGKKVPNLPAQRNTH